MMYLAVSILAENEDDFQRQLKRAAAEGAEAVEIRADALTEPNSELVLKMMGLVKKHKLPVIVTCRDCKEGGIGEIDFSGRLKILRAAVKAGADFVDCEYRNFKHPDARSVLKAALEESPKTKLILSAHNFEGPFEDLTILYESILSLYPESVPKIVYHAAHINDCFAVFHLLQEADGPLIAFCMGQAGLISRVLAKKLGAAVTFACLDEGGSAAPGQVPLKTMKQLYRWDAQNEATEIFGVIGNPVAHSLSPLLFNACFEQEGINAVYLPFLVDGDQTEFDVFLEQVVGQSKMGFGGFSVTIPHKGHALNYAVTHGEYMDPLAQTIGSVNTLKIGFNGIMSAYNTDYSGAIDALTTGMGMDKRGLHHCKVAVIGAGGAARAVIAGLVDAGARVTVYNRTVSRAQSLARQFRCKVAPLEAIGQTDATILINCTSMGMSPDVEGCPVPQETIRPQMTVFDTVYNPLETRLLQCARQAGARTIDGAQMFVRQAIAQYRIFIGNEGDEELMRRVVHEKLKANQKV